MMTQKPERKDWVLLIFIIPIGVLLILFVGQWAIRLLPSWIVNSGMNSNLEPDAARPLALLEPLLPQILIPLPWEDSYLDPGGDISFPPFLTFEPTASPSPTAVQPTSTEATPTATTPSPSPTKPSATPKTPSPTKPSETEPSPSATTPSPSPTTPSPSPTTPSPSPTTPSPSPTTPSPSPTTPSPSPTTPPPPICPGAHTPDGPLPCDYGTTSTPPVGATQVTPDPAIDVGAPPNEDIGLIDDGSYIVLNLSVTVDSAPDNLYDLVFYEWENGGNVYLDMVIIGVTNDVSGSSYYEVFNWGNNIADTNSNVSDLAAGGEQDDEMVPLSDPSAVPPNPDTLHDPDYNSTNGTNGPLPQTGILIDVENAA
ncbi:MAG: hypothetical protein RL536_685, partial [Candidatus Parcubacteria bacterium]